MRKPFILLLPVALMVGLCLLLRLAKHAAAWPQAGGFIVLPYFLFAVALILGFALTQSRIAHVAFLMAATAQLVNRFFFANPDPGRGQATILMASLCIPAFAALSYRMSERGVFTPHGVTRSLIFLATVALIGLTPAIPSFARAVGAAHGGLAGPMSAAVPLPGLGLLAFAACLPFLIRRKEHESPFLGPQIAFALLFFLNALSFRASAWGPGRAQTALSLFMSGAAVALLGAIIESAWQHANIDELTQLPGRRFLKYHLRCLGSSYAIAIVDIDRFKRINDGYGHDVGDQVLRFVAALLARNPAGAAYRYGGEEFVIVSRLRSFANFVNEMEHLREAVSRKEFVLRGPDRPAQKPKEAADGGARPAPAIHLTVSIGVAASTPKYDSPQQALEAADRALYRAKQSGRNQVWQMRDRSQGQEAGGKSQGTGDGGTGTEKR